MASTLQNIKAYIASLPSFPVNRTTNVFYGNTDSEKRPLVLFSDLEQTYERHTCGIVWINSTFNIHVLTDGATGTLANAEAISETINDFFDNQKITQSCGACFVEKYSVITEPTYIYHVVRGYSVKERFVTA